MITLIGIKLIISYVRLTIGRIDPDDQEVEFVDTLMSPERSIFSSKKLVPGEYIILVEVYWEQQEHNAVTLGTYSEGPVILEKLTENDNLYNMSEYMIWRSFANQKRSELTKMNPNYIYDKGVNVTVDANKYKNQNYAMVLYDYLNTSQNLTAHQVVGIAKSSGFDIVSAVKTGKNCDLIMNPGENDVILFKMDPRSQGFSLSHRVVQEELLEKNFSKPYQSVFEILNELGGVNANPNKPSKLDPKKLDGLTNHLKDKLLEEQKMKSKAEKIRQMKEAEQRRKEKIKKQREKQFHKSKLGRYDPMNLIFGFKGGSKDILSMFEKQGIGRGWNDYSKKRQRGKGHKGMFSNFSGLGALLSGFGGGGQGQSRGGYGNMGGGMGMLGGIGQMLGFNQPSQGYGQSRGQSRSKSRKKSRNKSRGKSNGNRGISPMYQNKINYQYADSQGNRGGYGYNLSNYNKNQSKINQDHSGNESGTKSRGISKKTKKQIEDPLKGKNSIFKNSEKNSNRKSEPEVQCGCI